MTEVFAELAALAERLGVSHINQLPACWEVDIGSGWSLALNGHGEPMRSKSGAEVPPYHCWVERNGWPMGLVSPAGGTVVGGSEDELIEAIRGAGK